MTGAELHHLIDQRWNHLRQLRDLADRQIAAIGGGNMSELMRVLSAKQTPIAELGRIAERLRSALDDDPDRRVWESAQQRVECRQRQAECEELHLQLLAIESQCEGELQKSRDQVRSQIERMDSGRAAANQYAEVNRSEVRGERLDLSSDS